MMESMMASVCAGGMWIGAVFGLLLLAVVVLAAAALIKYLFGTRNRGHG